MEKLGEALTRAGSIMRDIFNYFIPSIPFIILSAPLVENIGLIKVASLKMYPFFDQSVVREVTLIIIIYVIGRFINAFSYPLFWIFENTIGRMKLKWITENKQAYNEIKDLNEFDLYIKAYAKGPDIFQLLFERNNVIYMSESSLSAGAFIIGILLILSYFFHATTSIFGGFLTFIYCSISFIVSITFYLMAIATLTDLHNAAKVVKDFKDK